MFLQSDVFYNNLFDIVVFVVGLSVISCLGVQLILANAIFSLSWK